MLFFMSLAAFVIRVSAFPRQTAPLVQRRVKVIRHNWSVKIEEKHAKNAYFRHFLSQHRPADVGF
jgi:hypothetical protein